MIAFNDIMEQRLILLAMIILWNADMMISKLFGDKILWYEYYSKSSDW